MIKLNNIKIWKQFFYYTFVCIGFVILIIFFINVIIHLTTRSYIYNSASEAPSAEVALIPGAAIKINGSLSPVFEDRADMAIKLYKINKVKKILVSGDNSTLNYNEVNPVRKYLIQNGVLDEDIFLDHAGFDTYSTVYRARDIFRVTSILIVTQSFHLPRAIFIAHALGITSYGVNADVGHLLTRNYVREIFANEKAVLDLIFRRKPKYLGDQIPVSGDGRNYR